MHIPAFARAAAAGLISSVFVPLYSYPGDGCANWELVINVTNCFYGVSFVIVVNPDNGAGTTLNSQPDLNYQTCIPKLTSSGTGNVEILGYVATGWGQQNANYSSSFVQNNITTYSNWASAYRPSGIFFDQAATDIGSFSLYQTYASEARAKFSGNTGDLGVTRAVMLNPGTPPDPSC